MSFLFCFSKICTMTCFSDTLVWWWCKFCLMFIFCSCCFIAFKNHHFIYLIHTPNILSNTYIIEIKAVPLHRLFPHIFFKDSLYNYLQNECKATNLLHLSPLLVSMKTHSQFNDSINFKEQQKQCDNVIVYADKKEHAAANNSFITGSCRPAELQLEGNTVSPVASLSQSSK